MGTSLIARGVFQPQHVIEYRHDLYPDGNKHEKRQFAEAEANARLVAAATDLLAALTALVAAEDHFERDTGIKLNDRITEAVTAARAAIAKATQP